MTREEWRPCFGGFYAVSNLGNVRRVIPGSCGARQLRPRATAAGYPRVDLHRPETGRRVGMVHQLVAAAFLGPRPPRADINHKDGVKTNNRVTNLEYVTRSENCKHAFRMGLIVVPDNSGKRHPWMQGERHRSAKLTAREVRAMRRERLAGRTLRFLGEKYGVTHRTAMLAVTGATWRHVA